MEVAIPQMTKAIDAHIAQFFQMVWGHLYELWNHRKGQRNIMAADRSNAAVSLWNGFTDRPYILRLLRGLCDDPITDQTSLVSQFKQAFKRI